MHGATKQTSTPRVLVVEGLPASPCTKRWAARNPNEKQVPNEANQAGVGACGHGKPCGRVMVVKGKGERGKMVMQKSAQFSECKLKY